MATKKSVENEEEFTEHTMRVRLHFTEDVLGTEPGDPKVFETFIGKNAPDAASLTEEIKTIGVEGVVEKGCTVFPHMADGTPLFWDYQIKGFMKDTCGGLARVKSTKSSGVKAYKKVIDKLIFPEPRIIPINVAGETSFCQRPLRAQTAQGERVALAMSESVPAGSTCEFVVTYYDKAHTALLREWFDYGKRSGIGQWRNSGKGRFLWEELDDEGNRIGGNWTEESMAGRNVLYSYDGDWERFRQEITDSILLSMNRGTPQTE